MANEEHVAILKQGVKVWNEWRENNPDIKPDLIGADLTDVDLIMINLNDAYLGATNLKEVILQAAMLQRAELVMANLEGANLSWSNLEGANLNGAFLSKAILSKVNLVNASLDGTDLSYAHLDQADLSYAKLYDSLLRKANLSETNLTGTVLRRVNLEEAELYGANLTATDLRAAKITGANLSEAKLANESLIGPMVFNTIWGDANLSNVDWSMVKIISDEYVADQNSVDGNLKNRETRRIEYKYAASANRQLSVKLTEQGLVEEASHFDYNYQICRRKYLRFSMSIEKGWDKLNVFRQWLFSWFLWALAGYGYKLGRAFIAYLIVIFGFGSIYWWFLGGDPIPAVVESINIFHGRGISSPDANLITNDYLLVFAGCEATIGLIIEVTFIAALTQKFFGK